MFSWPIICFKNFDPLSFLLGIVLSAIFGTWLNYLVARPKLKVSGSGGGGGPGPGFYQNNLRIRNEPGLIGLRYKQTVVFGKRIIKGREFGLIIDRNPTHECTAFLYEKETGEYIKQLWWRSKSDPNKMVREVTLESGEDAELVVFAYLYDDSKKFFVYEPQDFEAIKLKIPPEHEKFDSTKEFLIKINYSYGKRTLVTDFKMSKNFGDRWSCSTNNGGVIL